MKTFLLIAALAMSLPGVADARSKGGYGGGYRGYGGGYRGYGGGYRGGYYGGRSYYGARSYYGGYRGGYYGGYRPYYGGAYYAGYRPFYGGGFYGGYGYPGYGYGYGGWGFPGISFVYQSSSYPRYGYSRSYYNSAYSSLEVDVQKALRRRGYYYGAIDGDIGPASRNAIRNYQANRGLKVTGRIDSSLLRSLGI